MAVPERVRHFIEAVLQNISDKPSPDITLKVFQFIETHPDYLKRYHMLGGDKVNSQIGQAVKDILGMENDGDNPVHVSKEECGLIGSYTRFKRRFL